MVVHDGLRVIRDVLTQKFPQGDVTYADGRPNQGHRHRVRDGSGNKTVLEVKDTTLTDIDEPTLRKVLDELFRDGIPAVGTVYL